MPEPQEFNNPYTLSHQPIKVKGEEQYVMQYWVNGNQFLSTDYDVKVTVTEKPAPPFEPGFYQFQGSFKGTLGKHGPVTWWDKQPNSDYERVTVSYDSTQI